MPVRVEAARRFPVPGGLEFVSAGGWTLGGALLARYDEYATLPYHELIVFSGLARAGARQAFVVSHIYVDSRPSLLGGRRIWGLPKERADFDWAAKTVTVAQDDMTLLQAALRFRAGSPALPLYAPVFGDRAGETVLAAGRGRLRGAPALATFEVPPASPFAGLGLAGRHVGVAGGALDLRFPPPHVMPGD